VQLQLAKIKNALPDKDPRRKLFGGLNITPEVVDWAEKPTRTLRPAADGGRFWEIVDDACPDHCLARLEMRANGDTMHHVDKGVLGIFIQTVDGLVLEDCQCADTRNDGGSGTELAGPYRGAADGGHAGQSSMIGYGGADVRGIYVGACSDVVMDGVRVLNTRCAYGSACGIEVAGASDNCSIDRAYVANVAAGADMAEPYPSTYPNPPARAIGLRVAADTEMVSIGQRVIEGELTQPGPTPTLPVEMLCPSGRMD
jgi:hypothetical protein